MRDPPGPSFGTGCWAQSREERHLSHLLVTVSPQPLSYLLSAFPERQTQAQNPRRCLALDKPNEQVTSSPDQKGGNVAGTATPPRCPSSCGHPKPVSSPPRGDRKGGRSWLTLLDVVESSVQCDISSWSLSSPFS